MRALRQVRHGLAGRAIGAGRGTATQQDTMAHILVIDDDDAVRWIIRRAMQAEGHSVTEAANGADGLRRFAAAPVDLVITDILMPEREGIETIIELRRGHPALPILAISGGSATTERDGLLASADLLGATEVLPKPFELDRLRATVRAMLLGHGQGVGGG